MATKPQDLRAQARVNRTKSPDPETIDRVDSKSGTAQDAPGVPRFDSVAQMSGTARPADAVNDKSQVAQTVDQQDEIVKPHVTGPKHRTVS